MMGTVGGTKNKIVTGCSVQQHLDFTVLMKAIESEANSNKFRTKGEAVARRNELVANWDSLKATAGRPELVDLQPAVPQSVGLQPAVDQGEDVF